MSSKPLAALIAALCLVATACSSDDGHSGSAPAVPSPTVEAPTPEPPAATPTAAPTAAPEPADDAGTSGADRPDPQVDFSVWPVLAADVGEAGCGDDEFVDGYCRAIDGPGIGPETVESAVASFQDPGGWVVNLVFTTEGIDAFNELALACFEQVADCPTARLAIEIDGGVLSAPQVQAPEFARDAIVISGVLDEDEAKAIAAALGGG